MNNYQQNNSYCPFYAFSLHLKAMNSFQIRKVISKQPLIAGNSGSDSWAWYASISSGTSPDICEITQGYLLTGMHGHDTVMLRWYRSLNASYHTSCVCQSMCYLLHALIRRRRKVATVAYDTELAVQSTDAGICASRDWRRACTRSFECCEIECDHAFGYLP